MFVTEGEAFVVEVFKAAAVAGADGAPDDVLHAATAAPQLREREQEMAARGGRWVESEMR